jgi:hypothetical protein
MHAQELRTLATNKRLEADALELACAYLDPTRRAQSRLKAATLRRKAAELEMAAQRQEAIGV